MTSNTLLFIHLIYFTTGRHLVALTKSDDSMRFFREHALKSVWKPIIAFQNDNPNEPLDYKPVNAYDLFYF
jgi:hypothetical protein